MKKIAVVFCLAAVLLCVASPVYAASGVAVQVPQFAVMLNDKVYDNQHAKYPLLVYNDVTYFPMTYQLTRSLGLVTGWEEGKGLYIAQHAEWGQEEPDMTGNNRLGGRYQATVPNYPIYVNGWQVKNSGEQYPLLNFRNVTYFPLSWHYAHDEFGWNINWDAKTGLRVDSYGRFNASEIVWLAQMENHAALFQQNVNIYQETINEYGNPEYNRVGEKNTSYRLDFAADTLTKGAEEKLETTWERHDSTDVSESFRLDGTNVMYNGKAILSNIPKDYTENPQIYAKRFSADSANMLAVSLYYNTEIPAPYTPKVQYVFVEKNGAVLPVKQWDEKAYPGSFYETAKAYYACSYGQLVTGRFSNSLHTIIRIDKTNGKETVLNDLYSQYRSLEAIGVADDKLYVRAIYWGEEKDLQNPQYAEKVNPLRDGYFYIDGQNKLHKVHDYIDGDPFLAPNGKLYVYDNWRLQVTNLTDHRRITAAE